MIDSENRAGPDGSCDMTYGMSSSRLGGVWRPAYGQACMKWVIIIVFWFTRLTVVAHSAHGYSGFFPPFADANTTQIFSDLVIALAMVNMWVFLDLRRRRDR